jgi:hypothetical protein
MLKQVGYMQKLTITIYASSLILSLILFEYYSNTYRKIALEFPLKNERSEEITKTLEKNFPGSFTQLKQVTYTCFQASFIKTKENKDFSSENLEKKLVALGLNKAEGISEIDLKKCPFTLMDQIQNKYLGWLVLVFFNFLFATLLADFIVKLRTK